ncbi:NrtR DNA-binding winged helix domain-containing protein [Flavobacterium hydrophilum]|uniref:NUDIX hydrolase n=1 Tax=Flavobacterium hydrophilum TaxID=2211445 RepID=A0A2V4BZL1_9FLAO|nr:NUDIX hydrolase [Flavobacterium hydrophilum]PXY43110.1 NUDIX hydrolase [Flavobacterium hydrophilum]
MNEVTIDCVVFGYDNGSLKVLLSRENKGVGTKWGLISGIVKNVKKADEAVMNLLNEFGNFEKASLKLLTGVGANSQTLRYYTVINIEDYRIKFGAVDAYQRWFKTAEIPDLIHDHNLILDYSLYQLETYVRESPVGFNLLPEKFTISELMNLYKGILGIETDKESFSRKFLKKKVLVPLKEKKENISNESDKLYKFNTSFFDKNATRDFVLDF